MPAHEFERIVEQLYAGPPDRFVAQRDAAVKQARSAGDKDLGDRVKALRRPTAAAALLNQLQRRADGFGLDELLELGERLRAAQSKLDVAAMKSLSSERNSQISRLVSVIAQTSSEPLSATVQEQLSDTLVAAVADAEAARAVGSGRLVSGLRYSGFGEIDLQDAVAIPLGPQSEVPDEAPADEPEEARDTGDHEAQQRADAERHVAEATAALAAARRAEESAQQSAELAERALTAARRTAKSTRMRAEQATAARSAAEQAVTVAEEAAAGSTGS